MTTSRSDGFDRLERGSRRHLERPRIDCHDGDLLVREGNSQLKEVNTPQLDIGIIDWDYLGRRVGSDLSLAEDVGHGIEDHFRSRGSHQW